MVWLTDGEKSLTISLDVSTAARDIRRDKRLATAESYASLGRNLS